jgi:Ig domain of plant-specific actin-binding protein
MGKLAKRVALALLTVTLTVGLVPSTQAWAAKKITIGTITVTGSARVGGKLTVTVTKSKPKKLTYTYQWYRAGEKIAKATKSIYRPTVKDWGKKLQLKVTAKKKGYKTRTRTIGLVNPIATGRLGPATVSISNAARCAGNTFGANMIWVNAPWGMTTFSYQWFRDGVAIVAPTAQTDSYKSTAADAGHYLSFSVRASAKGYYSETATSAKAFISTC